SVIFIRDHNTLGQEVSGYIDYAHRLKTQDFEPYFSGKMRLMPGRSDLCFLSTICTAIRLSDIPTLESTISLLISKICSSVHPASCPSRCAYSISDVYFMFPSKVTIC
ncbi:hypothetical protein KUCAC02_028277, partial [Chaenocephalus aceratus]